MKLVIASLAILLGLALTAAAGPAPTITTMDGRRLELTVIQEHPLDAGPPPTDALVIAHVEVPTTPGAVADLAVDAGLKDEFLAMIVGFVLLAAMGLRAGVDKLRSGRIVGWAVNVALTGGAVVFMYLAEDLKLDRSAIVDIVKGVILNAGGWQILKPMAPKATKTVEGA